MNDTIEKSHEQEIEFEHRSKRKSVQVLTAVGQDKRPKTSIKALDTSRFGAVAASVASYTMVHVEQQVQMFQLWSTRPHE